MRVNIGVAYGTDLALLKRVLLEVAAAHKDVLKTPPPTVFFHDFGESSLNFELGVWTETMTHYPRRFRSELNFAIEQALRENRIEIPFPQRVVHVRGTPDAGIDARHHNGHTPAAPRRPPSGARREDLPDPAAEQS